MKTSILFLVLALVAVYCVDNTKEEYFDANDVFVDEELKNYQIESAKEGPLPAVSYQAAKYKWKKEPTEEMTQFNSNETKKAFRKHIKNQGNPIVYYDRLLEFINQIDSHNPLNQLPEEIKVDKDYNIMNFDLERFIEEATFYSNLLTTAANWIDDRIQYLYDSPKYGFYPKENDKIDKSVQDLLVVSEIFGTASNHVDITVDKICNIINKIKELNELSKMRSVYKKINGEKNKYVKELKDIIFNQTFESEAKNGIKQLKRIVEGRQMEVESKTGFGIAAQENVTKGFKVLSTIFSRRNSRSSSSNDSNESNHSNRFNK